MKVLTVKNSKRARVGDTVKIGLVQAVQYKGYFLAYVVPPAALIFGVVAGQYLGAYAGFPPLDIIMGLFSMTVISFFSFRRLKRLNASHSIEIVKVLYDPWNPGSLRSDERAVPEYFTSHC